MENLINRGDAQARLSLVRYGLVIIVVLAFVISVITPMVIAGPYAAEFDKLVDAYNEANNANLEPAVVPVTNLLLTYTLPITVVTAILAVVVYFVYRMILMRSVGKDEDQAAATT